MGEKGTRVKPLVSRLRLLELVHGPALLRAGGRSLEAGGAMSWSLAFVVVVAIVAGAWVLVKAIEFFGKFLD